jgi:uncharacterized membrane protein (UPF0127 family)
MMRIFHRLAMNSFSVRAIASMAFALCAMPARAEGPLRFPTMPLNAGIHVIQAEVAATPAQRAQGLMYREKMGVNEGMVFLFGEPQAACMWMKNTLIPLSAAFLDERGKIINIEDMTPQTTVSHCAKAPAKYVLEMNQGWFQRKNIKPGMTIDGLPK